MIDVLYRLIDPDQRKDMEKWMRTGEEEGDDDAEGDAEGQGQRRCLETRDVCI